MSRTTDDTEQTECTIMDCSGDAEFAYWMPDLGHFSEVRSPENDFLEDGDLAPYVCESCRDRMASSLHWDEDRFSRPEEKLVTDGGHRGGASMSNDDTTASGKNQSPYWRCKGCGELFVPESYEEQIEHAEDVHGSYEAVSFKAVPSWEVHDDTEA